MEELKVKAIPAYDRYASNEPATGFTTVWGIDGDELDPVSLESAEGESLRFLDFMVVDGVVYFQVQLSMTTTDEETGEKQTIPVVHYYSQNGSTITEIEAADYPDKPERVRVSYDGDLFKVVTTEYNGDTYSYVYQGPLCCAYAVIDSYVLKNEGLWFSVSESMNLRPAGIYFFRKGEGRITEVCDGRIW